MNTKKPLFSMIYGENLRDQKAQGACFRVVYLLREHRNRARVTWFGNSINASSPDWAWRIHS